MKQNQQQKILGLLQSHRNEWVPLPQILALGVAQYNSRIKELRGKGHLIQNKVERVNGEKHSWFRIVVPVRYQGQMTLGIK